MTSSLLIQEPPLQVLPSLAKAIGLNEAIALQQLHWWLSNPKVGADREGHRWIYNTYAEWRGNFPFWSERTIQRTFENLERRKYIISKQFDKKRRDMTKFYRIDYGALEKLEHAILASSEHDKLASSRVTKRHAVNRNTQRTTQTPERQIAAFLGIEDK